jgi:hypothetical protein
MLKRYLVLTGVKEAQIWRREMHTKILIRTLIGKLPFGKHILMVRRDDMKTDVLGMEMDGTG